MIVNMLSQAGVYVGTAEPSHSKDLCPLLKAVVGTRKMSPSHSASTGAIHNATVSVLPPAPEDSLTITSMRLGQPPQPDRNIRLDNLPQPLLTAADNIVALREAGISPEVTRRLAETLNQVFEALG